MALPLRSSMRDTVPIITIGRCVQRHRQEAQIHARDTRRQRSRATHLSHLNLSGNQRLSHGRTAADIRHLGAQAILFE